MPTKSIIVIHKSPHFIQSLKGYLTNAYTIVEKQYIQSLFMELRINQVVCIILYIDKDQTDHSLIEQIKKGFSQIPCIVVIHSPCLELARYFGSIGIECVLSIDRMYSIKEDITRLWDAKNNKVYLHEFSIDMTDPIYSEMIRESLFIMERDYQKIFSVNKIADLLEVNECTLVREHKKYDLPTPKTLLLLLKVSHAIKLMQNKGLNIREIALQSGFTDEKRMAENFHRMFGMPPGEYTERKLKTKN